MFLFFAPIPVSFHTTTAHRVLTTQSNERCSEYHHRMPLLISKNDIITWISGKHKGFKMSIKKFFLY
ncbi:SOS response-associated peptidase family protein [Vibrio diabolicus]|uniref:SOS response-associated peptidase family protein n=1 Tax=Vibrio diabolicus TaxID=50719 RepID=UPI0035A6CB05